jgi:hypothetical protein
LRQGLSFDSDKLDRLKKMALVLALMLLIL